MEKTPTVGVNFIINAHIIRLILCNYTNIPISGYFFIKPLDNIPFSVYNVIVRKTQRAQPKRKENDYEKVLHSKHKG